MSIYTITIKTQAFNNIKNETKKIEGRLYRGIFTKINIGNTIIFHDKLNDEKLSKIVKKLVIFDSFEIFLNSYPLKNILPGKKTIEEGIKHYNKIYKIVNKKILSIELL